MPINAPVHEQKSAPPGMAAKSAPAPVRAQPAVAPAWERALGAAPIASMPLPMQTKLTVNQPGDEFEQQADRVADQVMRMPAPRLQRSTCACGGEAGPDGECAACKAARLGLQRSATSANTFHAAPPIVYQTLQAPGQPLDPGTRALMESRFGANFGGVRVHTNQQAAQSARAVNANAYTVGHNVVFGAGRFAPTTYEGQHLLAHELAHVVQQSSPGVGTTQAARPQIAPTVQRQAIPMPGPWFRPIPIPRVGPLPRVGPMPEVGPMPPIVVPMPGEYQPELEVEDIPDDEAIEVPEGSADPQPSPDTEPSAEAEPQPGPWPVPPVAPRPTPEDEQEDQNVCGSRRMPLTQVSWTPGPFGQGGTVRASPLTRCPGNTRGSMAMASTYRDQFQCIRNAGLSRTWLPLHLLHGATRRTGARNLHGPGNERWNIIIGDAKLNGDMYKSVEDFVVNRVYDWNQVLWLESKVDEYFPGAEFFAKRVTLTWGLYNTTTNSEVTTIGGGTFQNDPGNLPPPTCPPTSRAGARALAPGAASASAYDTTISICQTSLTSQRPFPVTNGGVELTLRTRTEGQNCDITNYTVTLWKSNNYWPDGEFGSKNVPANKTVRLRWRYLPPGDYYFIFTVGPHNPGCCLKGDMSVRTFSAQAGTVIMA